MLTLLPQRNPNCPSTDLNDLTITLLAFLHYIQNQHIILVLVCSGKTSLFLFQVSTEETSELGAKPEYMHKLLTMVRQRIDSIQADITLKFTLGALWNLTDESATTCAVFLDQQGVQLFLRVLSVFQGNSAIETKVLGEELLIY